MSAEVHRIDIARREVEPLQQEVEVKLLQAAETVKRARRRARTASKVVERYRSAFEEIRDELRVIAERIDSTSAAIDIEVIIEKIEEIAQLDPDDD